MRRNESTFVVIVKSYVREVSTIDGLNPGSFNDFETFT